MKQFFTLALIAGALMLSAPSQARIVSTKAQCVAACGNAITETCGWITKRGKFNRCRAKLYNQCKRFGTDAMCPAQVAPTDPPPSVTTPPPPDYPPTTPPPPYYPPTTTTTLPYFPTTTTSSTTTTTLPTIPSVVGSYVLGGTVVSDTCGYYGSGSYLSIPFGVTYQSGSSLLGTIGNGSMSSSGAVNAGGSWYLISDSGVCDSYCCYQASVSTSSATFPSYSTWSYTETCTAYPSCAVEVQGTAVQDTSVVPTTTTTTTSSTTTTTLPTIPSVVGSYVLGGTVVSDTCGYYGSGSYLSIPFGVTYQSGSSLLGTIGNGSMSSSGAVNAGGSWYLISNSGVCDSYCCYQASVSTSSATFPSYSTWSYTETCTAYPSCAVKVQGTSVKN